MLRNFIIRLIINAVALAVTASLLSGIQLRDDSLSTLLIVALVFGVINALVKPIVKLLTCPMIILTLGLFALVVNALMLLLTSALVPEHFYVENFGWAFLGGIVIAIVAMVMESVFDRVGFDD